LSGLSPYQRSQTYDWNYAHAPEPVERKIPHIGGVWTYCGRKVESPLGIPAGPLLNGKWCLYYASLGFDVLTYKTVRSRQRDCFPLPNLQPVDCGQLHGDESDLPLSREMRGSWAVSFGMPSKPPETWRADVEATRRALPPGKLLPVSVVGTIQDGWTIDQLADDYATCAKWATESGADCVEVNFSCPNVSTCDGQLYQQFHDAKIVAQRVREAIGAAPLIVKVGHIQSDEQAAGLVSTLHGIANAISTTNSVAATVCDSSGRPLFGGQRRGICGAGIRKASLAQTSRLRATIESQCVALELIGVGDVSDAGHVQEYLNSGAQAVQLATAAMINPNVAIEIKSEMARWDFPNADSSASNRQ
jgi:dihydroorotate dehydrogenase